MRGHEGKTRSLEKPHILENEQRAWSSSAFPVIEWGPTPGTALLGTHVQRIQGERTVLEMQTQLWHAEWRRNALGKNTLFLFHLL